MNRTIAAIYLSLTLVGPVVVAAADDHERRSLRLSTVNLTAGANAATPTAVAKIFADSSTPVSLSLREAIDRGLRHNLSALLSEQEVRVAEGSRWKALGDLLPTVSAQVLQGREMLNTAAFGFPFGVVGPFNLFDARVFVTQPLLNLEAVSSARAAAAEVDAERHSYDNARALVVLAVANLYLQAVADANRLAEAQARAARAELLLAADRKDIGLARRLQSQRQRIVHLDNALTKRKLALARAISLPRGQEFTLVDDVSYSPVDFTSLEQAIDRAYRGRADYQGQLASVNAAEARLKAASSARFPSVAVEGDYGDIGPSVSTAEKTFGLRVRVKVPVFDAERHGKVVEAHAELRQEKAKLEDLRESIYYEVRTALLDLRAADAEVQLAQNAVRLAEEHLSQTSAQGLTSGTPDDPGNIQAAVTAGGGTRGQADLEEAVAVARDVYISTLYMHNAAKLSLVRALGSVEKTFSEFLRGTN